MDKKEQILIAAMKLLVEKGVQATPMSAIAKAAGTGMGTIYNYFATKEELINAINSLPQPVSHPCGAVQWGTSWNINLVAYTRSYALEFFENTTIKCSVIVNEDAPQLELEGIKRRNLFFAVKEILNNTIKNSNVSEVTLRFEWNDNLKISISDDGDNIHAERQPYFENSFSQIKNRMLAIGGDYSSYYRSGNLVVLQVAL